MLLLQAPQMLQRLPHKPIWAFLLLFVFVVFLDKTAATTATDDAAAAATTEQPAQTTTVEPDASPGCKAPDIRFTIVRPETTTEQPYAKFETTQIYMPEDLTTADGDYVQRINVDLMGKSIGGVGAGDSNHAAIVNPYQVDTEEHHEAHDDEAALDDEDDEEADAEETSLRNKQNQNRRINKKRRSGGGKRRRLENENGQSRGRGGRYKRQLIHHDPDASPETDKWSGSKLAAEGDVYYVHIEDILKSQSPNPELRLKLHKLKKKSKANRKGDGRKKSEKCMPGERSDGSEQCQKKSESSKMKKKTLLQEKPKKELHKAGKKNQHHRRRGDSHEDKHHHGMKVLATIGEPEEQHEQKHGKENEHVISKRSLSPRWQSSTNAKGDVDSLAHAEQQEETVYAAAQAFETNAFGNNQSVDGDVQNALQRVKRKSGKTTGALSRPKGGGDSSSKTTSRKDKGIFDEEGGYSPVHPDEVESEEDEEEEEEVDIQQQFTEVSEIRFPGEIGPLGDRRLCKIRCVKGKWVGPLCATNEEGK